MSRGETLARLISPAFDSANPVVGRKLRCTAIPPRTAAPHAIIWRRVGTLVFITNLAFHRRPSVIIESGVVHRNASGVLHLFDVARLPLLCDNCTENREKPLALLKRSRSLFNFPFGDRRGAIVMTAGRSRRRY